MTEFYKLDLCGLIHKVYDVTINAYVTPEFTNDVLGHYDQSNHDDLFKNKESVGTRYNLNSDHHYQLIYQEGSKFGYSLLCPHSPDSYSGSIGHIIVPKINRDVGDIYAFVFDHIATQYRQGPFNIRITAKNRDGTTDTQFNQYGSIAFYDDNGISYITPERVLFVNGVYSGNVNISILHYGHIICSYGFVTSISNDFNVVLG